MPLKNILPEPNFLLTVEICVLATVLIEFLAALSIMPPLIPNSNNLVAVVSGAVGNVIDNTEVSIFRLEIYPVKPYNV